MAILTESDKQAILFAQWSEEIAREKGLWILSFREYLWSAWLAAHNANSQGL